ncbi:MAG TPA: hypothetical protein VE618_09195 [Myxococcaceae bacterium]|nr:hypothetical protein [Myxococcaceae bacterium]
MEWKDPAARLYARIAAVDPAAGDARSVRSPLGVATGALLSACFAVAVACGPAVDDVALDPKSRSSRVDGAGCDLDPDGGVPAGGDTSCTGTASTSATFTTASTGADTSTGSTGTNTSTGTGSTTTLPPPPADDAGVPMPG